MQKKLICIFSLLLVFFLSTSCGDGSDGKNFKIPGVKGPYIKLIEDKILISSVIEKLHLDAGGRFTIPKYKHSYIEISPDLESGGTLIAAMISLKDVFNEELGLLDPKYLPGGRALPGVLSGSLPAVAMTIKKFNNITLYIGPKHFGLFIPIKKLEIENTILSFRHYVEGKRVGTLSLVGSDENNENAGILLMLDLNNSTKKRLQNISNKY